MPLKLEETTLRRETVYTGRIVNVRQDLVRLPDGREALREVVEHPGGVAVLPLTADRHVVLVRQFRYPFGEILWEIPAGKLEPGEDPAACGLRELREETGYTADRYEPLGVVYASPGIYGEKLYLFVAREIHYVGDCPDDGEFLNVETRPLDEVVRMILDGTIKDSKTIAAVLWAREKLKC